ncbi:carboxypeptidase Taq [Endobacter medicaginis]|uniref:Metal-dependent carboxypeptidase n=1 Tax=Endobacter medicaginis TaxID=1181271 RepID=A0A839V0N4_9PROT|nr:carboxypeptidase M32 [Endobacter medicaginis]MBB3174405.1 carboxypeptidase Taq [Endobacter medicaginis]MCX5475310.1 carboxypeptidase M32 [Endobacter medicaginis]NVN30579.1 carboxypeptidase M32 [Endobacter medicaginis]
MDTHLSNTAPAYDRLKQRFARIATLGEAAAMLGWDAQAMMPDGGSEARGEQLATLSGLAHEMLVAPETGALLEAASTPDSSAWDVANLRLMKRSYLKATVLPGDLVEALSRQSNACEMAWRQARAESDFAAIAPKLEGLLSLVREQATALSEVLSLSPYDALMDEFQPGIGAADAAPIFARYEAFLRDNLDAIEARQAAGPAPVALPALPIDAQEALCRDLAARVGLDFDHARLDRSIHPFCGGTPTDIRITTRYSEADPSNALYAVVHETGHALYEAGLPKDWRGRQPVGQACGMAAHESQSLSIEMQACRSDAFLSWLGPFLAERFGDHPAYAPDNLARAWRRVERGFIRVDADEVTYPAHVILRFRLEQAMIAGDLKVADLPGAWAEGLHALLGVTPPDDARGCLQDIHWYSGAFGYFPSYSLGAMTAAQLMDAARAATLDLDAALATGDFRPLRGWMAANVHAQGSLYGFNDLLRHATGAPLGIEPFLAHLRRRYLD